MKGSYSLAEKKSRHAQPFGYLLNVSSDAGMSESCWVTYSIRNIDLACDNW